MTPAALQTILPGTGNLAPGRPGRAQPVEQAASFSQTLDLSVQALATANPVAAAATTVADERVPGDPTENPAVDAMALLLAGVQMREAQAGHVPAAQTGDDLVRITSASASVAYPIDAGEAAAADPLAPTRPAGLNLSPALPGAAAASMTSVDSRESAQPGPVNQGRRSAHGAGVHAWASPDRAQTQPADGRAARDLLERAVSAETPRAPASQLQATGAVASSQAALLAAAAPLRAGRDATTDGSAAGDNTPGQTSAPSIATGLGSAAASAAASRRVTDGQPSAGGQFAQEPVAAAGRVVRLEAASADDAPVDAAPPSPPRGELSSTAATISPVAALAAAAPAAPGQAVVVTIPQVAPAVGSDQWAPALAHHLGKLAPGKEVELNLNPEQLGPLKVTLTMADSRAQLAFTSEHVAVRQALEAALPQLRASFADSGISLGHATVGHGSGSSAGEARSEHSQGRPQGQPEPRAGHDRADGGSGTPARRAATPVRSGGVDTFA